MANYPIYRLVKGSTLSFTEMDGNLEWLSRTMSASIVTITGSTFVLGNLTVSDGITSSLQGTSSWANNTVSASYVSGSGAIVTNLTSSNDANINGLTIGKGASNINKNTVVGKDAFLLNTVGDNNVAIGAGTLASSSEGNFNTAVGTEALQYNTLGSYNIAIGGWTMRNNTTGILNTAVGTAAMINTTIGNNNSAFGNSALYYNIGGDSNSAFGYQSMLNNISGIQNTAVGNFSLYSNGIGSFNTAVGGSSGNTATSGSYNTTIGYQSGLGNVSGSNNTIIGSRVIGLPVGLSNNIILADGAGNIKYRWDGTQNSISGGLSVTGGSITGSNMLLTGTLTVQTIVAQTITASTEWITGSSKFGSLITDTHQFTGSVLAPSITGSLQGTSSWAVSASWAPSAPAVATISSYIATGSVTASVNSTDISASFRVTSGSNTLLNVTRDGFVWIGNGSFTNQGYQLDVNGTARVASSVNSGLYESAIFNNSAATANRVIINHTSNTGFGLSISNVNKFSNAVYSPLSSSTYSYAIFNDQIGGTSGNAIFIHGATNNISLGGITDAGFKLDVNGTARVSGYTLFGSGNSGTPLATLTDFRGGSDSDFIQVARASTSSDRYVRIYANGQIDVLSTKTDSPPFTFAAASNANTSGNRGLFSITNTFNPTSGTATYTAFQINQTISQSGGANGITRALYINPTITSASDFRAIETSAGNVIFGTSSAGFYWDNTNSRLGIGTNTPAYTLDTNGSFRVTGLGFSTGYSLSVQRLQFNNGTAGTNLGYIVGTSNGIIRLVNAAETDFTRLQFGGTTTAFPALQRSGSALCVVDGTGGSLSNFLIGGIVDSSQRLQVYGDAFIKGSGATSATFALTVQNSGGHESLLLANNGQASFRGTLNNDTTNVLRVLQQNGTQRFSVNTAAQVTITGESFTTNDILLSVTRNSFNPTSGTATHSSISISTVINQTGGANGITRGLYVNPTLTAAANWRSVEWSNNSGFGLYGDGTANNYLGGKLGIGVTSPSYSLQVNSNSDDLYIAAAGNAPSLNLLNSNSPTLVGTVGLSTSPNNFIQNSVPGDLCISTRGSSNSAAYIMFGSGSTMIAYISGSGDMYIAGTLTQGSTRNIKQNIAPITNAISTVMQIQGVTYDKKDGSAINEPGFIAEDMYSILPSLVSLNRAGEPQGIKYTNLTAYLLEAIKEQQQQINNLQQQINTLTNGH